MITITGLTVRQKTLMEMLWKCNTMSEVEQIIDMLPTKKDQYDARSLVNIASLEALEEEGGLDAYRDDVLEIIDRARG